MIEITIFQQLIKIKFFGVLVLLLGAFCTIREKLSFVEKLVIAPTIILGGLAQLYHKKILGLNKVKKNEDFDKSKGLTQIKYPLVKFFIKNLAEINKELISLKNEEDQQLKPLFFALQREAKNILNTLDIIK